MIDVETFANILFDKKTQEQFLKECEELGISDEESEGENDEKSL